MRWLPGKKAQGAKCVDCRGTGLRWGWWTILITLPIQVIIEGLIMALPWLVLIGLLVVGYSVYAQNFMFVFYMVCAVAGFFLVHYGVKAMFPACIKCGGKGRMTSPEG